jgi:hypothetical protein
MYLKNRIDGKRKGFGFANIAIKKMLHHRKFCTALCPSAVKFFCSLALRCSMLCSAFAAAAQ